MTKFEPDVTPRAEKLLKRGAAEWLPVDDGSVRAIVRDVDTKRIIEHAKLRPAPDRTNAEAAALGVAVVSVLLAAGGLVQSHRERKRLDRELTEARVRIAELTAELEAAVDDDRRAAVASEIAELEAKVVDLATARTKIRQRRYNDDTAATA